MKSLKCSVGAAFLLGLTLCGPAQTQTVVSDLSVNEARPLAAMCREIEHRSGVPVNYEDVRYENPRDLRDVTETIMNSQQRAQAAPGVRVIVPAGGPLSARITTDAQGRLPDLASAAAALASAIASFHGEATSRFTMTQSAGALSVVPSRVMGADGQLKNVTPVLSAAVTLRPGTRNGMAALVELVNELTARSGQRVEVGTIPVGLFATSNVDIGAHEETADLVLAKLLAAINGGRMSYSLLYDAQEKLYALNLRVVEGSNTEDPRSQPPRLPSSADGVYFKKVQ